MNYVLRSVCFSICIKTYSLLSCLSIFSRRPTTYFLCVVRSHSIALQHKVTTKLSITKEQFASPGLQNNLQYEGFSLLGISIQCVRITWAIVLLPSLFRRYFGISILFRVLYKSVYKRTPLPSTLYANLWSVCHEGKNYPYNSERSAISELFLYN